MIERLVIGISIIAAYKIPYILFLPIVLLIFQTVYFFIQAPFKSKYMNYRAIANYIISIVILSIYFYYAFDPISSATSPISIYLPLIILGLLLTCIIYSAIFIIRKLVKSIKDYLNTNTPSKPSNTTQV